MSKQKTLYVKCQKCTMKLPIGYLSPRGWCGTCEYNNHIRMRDAVVHIGKTVAHGKFSAVLDCIDDLIQQASAEITSDFNADRAFLTRMRGPSPGEEITGTQITIDKIERIISGPKP